MVLDAQTYGEAVGWDDQTGSDAAAAAAGFAMPTITIFF